MSMLGTMGFSAGEVAFFSPPPRTPRWPGGGSGEPGRIGRLIRLIRRELANGTTQPPIVAVPRLRNFPY